jgi:hypothetical protein
VLLLLLVLVVLLLLLLLLVLVLVQVLLLLLLVLVLVQVLLLLLLVLLLPQKAPREEPGLLRAPPPLPRHPPHPYQQLPSLSTCGSLPLRGSSLLLPL